MVATAVVLSAAEPAHTRVGGSILHASSIREDIRPDVTVRLGNNPYTKQRELEFFVVNHGYATCGVRAFAAANLPRPMAARYPPEWMAFYGFDGRDSVVAWACIDTLTPVPPGTRWDLFPSPYEIQPGGTMHFVALVEKVPPALRFYAEGFDTIPDTNQQVHTIYERGWSAEVVLEPPGDRPRPRLGTWRDAAAGSASGSTSISFTLPAGGDVNPAVFEVGGTLVKRLMARYADAGSYGVSWDGRNERGEPIDPGTYLARLIVNGRRVGERKVVIPK
jgi:hypothetical protein